MEFKVLYDSQTARDYAQANPGALCLCLERLSNSVRIIAAVYNPSGVPDTFVLLRLRDNLGPFAIEVTPNWRGAYSSLLRGITPQLLSNDGTPMYEAFLDDTSGIEETNEYQNYLTALKGELTCL